MHAALLAYCCSLYEMILALFFFFFFFSRRHSKHGSSNVHSLVRLHTALCKEQERWTLTNWLLSCQASDVARKCCLLKGSKCRFVMLSLVEGLNVLRLNAEAIAAGTLQVAIQVLLEEHHESYWLSPSMANVKQDWPFVRVSVRIRVLLVNG